MPAPSDLPIVAIVGRPNVGKSTLFNRFAGHRRALVEDRPGITRDRIVEEVEAAGRRVLLVDTAGLDPVAGSELDAAVQDQARAALEEADAVLLVVDGQVGLLPPDRELARLLRRTRKPVAVAVNKIDVPAHRDRVGEFHALGLEPLGGISAEHGSGAWDLLENLVGRLPVPEEGAAEAEPGEPALHVALVGRPNAGKSSLLNRLIGEERVVVSEVPGTTRDAVDTRLERPEGPYVFVDTAGLRRPGRRDRIAEQASAMMTLRAVERASVALVVVDADDGFTDQDAKIVSLVRQRGCAAALALNKWDLVEKAGEDAQQRLQVSLERRLGALADHPLIRVSARTGRGTGRIFPLLRRLGEAASRRIPTAELNRWLEDCVASHEPGMAQRGSRKRPLKFFYATQTGERPPSFALFCTQPDAVQESYRRYLENRLRRRFDLDGVPIRLRLRARRDGEKRASRRP